MGWQISHSIDCCNSDCSGDERLLRQWRRRRQLWLWRTHNGLSSRECVLFERIKLQLKMIARSTQIYEFSSTGKCVNIHCFVDVMCQTNDTEMVWSDSAVLCGFCFFSRVCFCSFALFNRKIKLHLIFSWNCSPSSLCRILCRLLWQHWLSYLHIRHNCTYRLLYCSLYIVMVVSSVISCLRAHRYNAVYILIQMLSQIFRGRMGKRRVKFTE